MASSARTREPAYNTWSMMKQRCNNPKTANYKWYGARGIKVCERWAARKTGYDNFKSDMGPKPVDCSLDRIDSDGDYEPDNCRWATHKEQHNNKRSCHFLTFQGETLTIQQWCEKLSLSRDVVRLRINKGLDVKDVLNPQYKSHWAAVAQLDMETGEEIARFRSLADAGVAMGCRDRKAGIFNALSSKTRAKSAYGFKWKYVDSA